MLYREFGKTGLQVSVLSQGGAAFGQQYGPISLQEARECVHAAVDAGINLIDTSAYYGKGRSEEILGDVLQGGLREKVYLCTKAGRLDVHEFDFSASGMIRCLDGSLKRLRTEEVDILIAHDIEFATDFEAVFGETADVLHKLKRQGKCRFIGMSGYPLSLLARAIESCELDVVISYAHFTLQNQRLLTDLLPLAQEHGVGVMNGSPLCLGLLTNQGPPPWHPGSDNLKAVARQAVDFCRQRGADISLLGMQYCLSEERIPTTITGAPRKEELLTNLKALTEPINRTLLTEVQELLTPIMNETWSSGHWRE